ncbi:MAG: hypothetical protein AB7E47_01565 [Desulfovibrionaceae bacterium]
MTGKRLLHYAGNLLSAASAAYVAYVLWRNHEALFAHAAPGTAVAVAVAGGIVYGAVCVCLPAAWWLFLSGQGVAAPWRGVYGMYARTQIAKYLPGNVMHMVGRQMAGEALGLSQGAMLLATFFEIALVAAAALGIALLGLQGVAALTPEYATVLRGASFVAVAGLLALVGGGKFFFARFPFLARMAGAVAAFDMPAWLRFLIWPFCAYLAFFLATGGVGYAAGRLVLGFAPESMNLLFFTGAYAAAWTLGFVTPGSPGGIGVRDAAMAALLAPALGQPMAVAAAVTLRCITTLGDVAFFASSYLPGLHQPSPGGTQP